MRTEAEMKCDVCGCVTGHLTIAKPPKRPKDECLKCYWTRELNIDGLKAERDAAVAEAWRLNAVEMLKKSAETERDAAIAERNAAQQMVAEMRECLERAQCQHVECNPVKTHNGCNARAILARLDAAPIAGRWVSRSAYDEALNAIMEGDKRLEAAIARAEKAEAREREIGEELDKATGMVEMHVGDAEAARLLWRSSEKACAHMDAQRAAARADRDAAIARAKKAEAELAQRTVHSRSVGHALRAFYARRELTLQVVAQAARLRLADRLAVASRSVLNEVLKVIEDDAGHDEPWFLCPHGDLIDALAAWDAVPGDVGPVDVG